jgi:aminoglycoside phosphotransferase (APT) family kinase protein
MTGWRDRSLLDLLAKHGLDLLPERELPTDGWSGATFSTIDDAEGRRFVLKRTSLERDWIARATDDRDLREGWLADLPPGALAWMPETTRPYLGAAVDDRDGGVAILSPDLSNELIAWERPDHDPAIDTATLDRVLRTVARLHAVPWSHVLDSVAERNARPAPPWCPLPERLTLLSPSSAARYRDEDNPVGERFLAGWEAFARHAPDGASELIDRLDRDVTPLVGALAGLPSVGLHGDLKLANVALLPDDKVGFIDWQMTMRAPIAVELGWLLVSNSGSLPLPADAVVAEYRKALDRDSGRWGSGDEHHDFDGLTGDWDAQVDLTWIVGLLLRGWRKGLDAEAGVTLPSGMTGAADLAWWSKRAVEAAERRL